jgi:hippurate hydrolase
MAATDEFSISVRGRSSHAAMPNRGIDPVVIAAHIITSLQSIVSRVSDPFDSTVVSVTKMQGGTASNVIPDVATLAGTIRTLRPESRDAARTQMTRIAEGIAAAHGAEATVSHHAGYPVTVNHPGQTEAAIGVANEIAGAGQVNPATTPTMGGEDFSYMLNARPGNFIFIGNGDTPGLHNTGYDFNDEIIPYGVSYWVRLAETRLAQIA